MNRHIIRALFVLSIVAGNLAGFAAVAPPAAASTAPLATAASFSLPTVDVTNSPGTVVLTVVTATTGAALQYGSVAVSGPNGGWQTAIMYPGQVAGTAVAAISVPQWSAAGTWSIDSLSLTDTLGVSSVWNSGTLPFVNPTLVVTDTNPDTAPPTASAAVLSPATLDVSNGPQNLTVTVTAADDKSGLSSGTLDLSAPDGSSVNVWLSPTTATTMTGTATIPQWSASQTWSIADLSLTDAMGNTAAWDRTTLPFTSPTLAVQDSTPDTAPPTASAASLSADAVDVTSSAQEVTITVTASDDASGTIDGYVDLGAPDGSTVHANLSPGTTAGTMVGTAQIPQGAAAGAWTIIDLGLTDAAGQSASWTAPGLPFQSPTLTVTSNPIDTTPPAVGALTPNAATVAPGGTLTVDAAATDDLSGVAQVAIAVQDPAGATTWYASDPGPTSGTTTDGHWTIPIAVPADATAGTWTVTEVNATDVAGNVTDTALATGPSFTVVTIPDAPTGVTASPGGGAASVTWTAPVNGADAVTGYAVRYSSDNGATWSDPIPATGSPATIPNLADGTSYVFEARATSLAGDGPWSDPSPLTTLATPPGAPAAPVVSAGNASAVVTLTAPSSNGGGTITGYALRYSADSGGTWSAPISAWSNPALISGLVNGATYIFQARATNQAGTGAWSASSTPVQPTSTTPPPSATSLAASSSTTLTFGSAYTATTTLTSGGAALANVPVSLWLRPANSSIWMPATTTVTNSTGAAEFTVKPKSGTWFQWRYAGDAHHSAATSSARLLAVRPTVGLVFASGRVRLGQSTKVYGGMNPGVVGTKVRLEIWTGKTWKSTGLTALVRKQRLPNGKTAVGYAIVLKPTTRGRLVYRVTTAATTSIAAASSPKGALTIR